MICNAFLSGFGGAAPRCGLAALAVASIGLLGGCEEIEKKYSRKHVSLPAPIAESATAPWAPGADVKPIGLARDAGRGAADALTRPEFYPGTTRRLNAQIRREPSTTTGEEMVTINFVNTSILEAVDVVLSETLGQNYIFDERVTGTVTVRTSNPIPKSTVLPVLENILALNGAALVQSGGVYNVVPIEAAASLPKVVVTPNKYPQRPGIGTYVIPVEFAAVDSVHELAKTMVSPPNQLAIDLARNLLIYTGPSQEAEAITDLVSVLDIDVLRGKSFGLYPLKTALAEEVTEELTMLFSDPSLAGAGKTMSFMPIARLNAILAITARPAQLEQVAAWVARLDRSDAEAGRRVYVYYAKNSRATDLVATLGQVFLGSGPDERRTGAPSAVAPGLTPVRETAEVAETTTGAGAAETDSAETSSPPPVTAGSTAPRPSAPTSVGRVGELRIVADERNNAVVLIATAEEFQMVEAALRQLDIMPLQVLIEATIAEVRLNENLEYGVQWAFQSGDFSATLANNTAGIVNAVFPGFNMVLNATEVQAALRLLSEVTDVEIVSSPQIMVLDNQPARLQVGDQVPVATGETISDTGILIQSSVQYFDTGVILEVTPRVNASGLVTLEILQEVSDAVVTESSEINSPTIQQRRIRSIVSVQSGETIALGGLIRERATDGQSGIPVLSDIPLVGNAFKTTDRGVERTELLVLITPRVIRGPAQAREVTDALRQRLTILKGVVTSRN